MATAHNPKPGAKGLPRNLIDKIGALSRSRIAEVEDFVDFIAQKDGEQALTRAAAAASAPAFAAVWSNPEDDVYDEGR
jgi:ABC-type glycerol-3-phosphate transport system substrate-binding protein